VLRGVIAALVGNYMTTFFIVGLVVGAIQVATHSGHRRSRLVSGLMLNSFVLFAIGCAQAVNFLMHSVFGDLAARSIGWAQSPFQLELAFSSLGVAAMAFILHGRRAQFRGKVAVVIATAIFAYGAAGGHVYQMLVNHDHAPNNTGLLLVMDLVIPTVGLVLVIWHGVSLRRGTRDADRADSVGNLTDLQPARAR
jgi:hypothetical protein